jgi:hypothetical protein
MDYRMQIIESPPGDPRQRYRGTGFCTTPGGLTLIEAKPGDAFGFEGDTLVSVPGPWQYMHLVKRFLSPRRQ